MKSKICAYCKKEFNANRKRTAEHIFPQIILELFPEQDVSFTPEKVFKDNYVLTIADVCNECNNGILSDLDQYSGKVIKEQFLDIIDYDLKDTAIEKKIDYELFSKWIIKIAYNYLRSRKVDCTFMQQYVQSILENKEIPKQVDIFMGLHINTAPVPERCYEYKPLQIVEEPQLLGTALGILMVFKLPIDLNSITLLDTDMTLVFRFGTAIVYVIFWKSICDDDLRKSYLELLVRKFNFKLLRSGQENYQLRRVTASTNISMGYWHLLSKSALQQDDMFVQNTLKGRSVKEVRENFEAMRSENDWMASKLLVEREMFPDNRKVKKEFEDFFEIEESD